MAYGHNGDYAYVSTSNPLLDFFSKAGSLMEKRDSFYGDKVNATELFVDAFVIDMYKSMQLAMWLRDCRGGSGNRSAAGDIFFWIADNFPEWINANIHFIPDIGRWDDLIYVMGTQCEETAVKYWAEAIKSGNGLAAKWTPREHNNKPIYHKLRKYLKLDPKSFRKLLANNTKVVETYMCNNAWHEINYNHVPSVAMARSVNAFTRNDTVRFQGWKSSLLDPKSGNKVNAKALFPHDCIRTLKAELGVAFKDGKHGFYTWSKNRKNTEEIYEDSEVANAQFAALPNYMEGTDSRLICLCDFSGSMTVPVSGNTMAIDVSMGLGLYCSDKIGKDNPFYRKFIPFSDDSRLVDWKNDSFSVAVQKHNDGFCGSTNVSAALDQILDAAKLFGASNDQIPNCLLILSDMQFDSPFVCGTGGISAIENGMRKWEAAGYTRPKIIYWNLGDCETFPDEDREDEENNNIALVSGFSPSILKSILEDGDFTPVGIMERAISKYKIVDPRTSISCASD